MKRIAGWILMTLTACVICSLVTYRIAHHRGYESGYRNGMVSAIGQVNFSQSMAFLAALQKLRAGDVAETTRFMEKSCFGSAHIFYKDPNPKTGEVSDWARAQGWNQYPDAAAQMAREVAKQLSEYRATYRTNSADWDDMERKLDVELAKLK